MKHSLYIVVATLLLAGCSNPRPQHLDQRAVADSYLKQAFINRYDDPAASIEAAQAALAYIADSLPAYREGRLRAWNCLATAYYVASVADRAEIYIDSVETAAVENPSISTAKVERVIAQLIKARLYQRQCDLAASYELLYGIERSKALQHKHDNLLYNYAQSEYLITALTLNYHYRDGMEQSVERLLHEAERQLPQLRCDYAQDMALNYAIAYAYSSLCNSGEQSEHNLQQALTYCLRNLEITADPDHRSLFHCANNLQLLAYIASNASIADAVWDSPAIQPTLQAINLQINQQQLLDTLIPDTASRLPMEALYVGSAYLFEQYGDPYQTLGAFVATGRRMLAMGDTAAAASWFRQAYEDYDLPLYSAPKFEARLYEGLIMTDTHNVAKRARILHELIDYIHHNEQADFALQTRLKQSEQRVSRYRVLTVSGVAVLLLLAALTLMLWRQALVLRREKLALQQAKQRDMERTSAVETCLSVMRHDIGPFIAYLQNPELPDSLHREVLQQLLRTFENIKNWTNLSIPEGLPFNAEECSLQAVMEHSLPVNPRPDRLTLTVQPTTLTALGDEGLLVVMLRNLVANAVRYTESGSITLSARSYEPDTRFVELTVADTGCGMDADIVDSLFRSDRAPQQRDGEEHYGFGLILCRYIVKKHDDMTLRGCRIWAESTPAPDPSHGTTFHILLAANVKQ